MNFSEQGWNLSLREVRGELLLLLFFAEKKSNGKIEMLSKIQNFL